jgi:magnesium chelatase family protein
MHVRHNKEGDMRLYSHVSRGYSGQQVGIEADLRNGFPGFDIVGLPDGAIKESRHRIRSALRNSGFKFPQERVLVNLAPADLPKGGSQIDLAIAVSLAIAVMRTYRNADIPMLIVGELGLDGTIHRTSGIAAALTCAKRNGCSTFVYPKVCGAIHDDKLTCIGVSNLGEAIQLIVGHLHAHPPEDGLFHGWPIAKEDAAEGVTNPFEGVVGMQETIRAMEIAAAGRHDLLLFGPPGAGKTMMATRLKYFLPPLSERQAEEIAVIYSNLRYMEAPKTPPQRMLSHNTSARAFFGDAGHGIPGEASLAHYGLLLLDELPSFSVKLLDMVRRVSDCGRVEESGGFEETSFFPAKFQIVATMNPCPCGGLGQTQASCVCSANAIRRHWAKIGTPLLDRFEIRLPVVPETKLEEFPDVERARIAFDSAKSRISAAVERQNAFWANEPDIERNGDAVKFGNTGIPPQIGRILDRLSKIPELAGRSARGMLSTALVAQTIAQIADHDIPSDEELEEAVSYQQYGLRDIYWREI